MPVAGNLFTFPNFNLPTYLTDIFWPKRRTVSLLALSLTYEFCIFLRYIFYLDQNEFIENKMLEILFRRFQLSLKIAAQKTISGPTQSEH